MKWFNNRSTLTKSIIVGYLIASGIFAFIYLISVLFS